MWTIEFDQWNYDDNAVIIKIIWNKDLPDMFYFEEVIRKDTTVEELSNLKKRAIVLRDKALAGRGRIKTIVENIASIFRA